MFPGSVEIAATKVPPFTTLSELPPLVELPVQPATPRQATAARAVASRITGSLLNSVRISVGGARRPTLRLRRPTWAPGWSVLTTSRSDETNRRCVGGDEGHHLGDPTLGVGREGQRETLVEWFVPGVPGVVVAMREAQRAGAEPGRELIAGHLDDQRTVAGIGVLGGEVGRGVGRAGARADRRGRRLAVAVGPDAVVPGRLVGRGEQAVGQLVNGREGQVAQVQARAHGDAHAVGRQYQRVGEEPVDAAGV